MSGHSAIVLFGFKNYTELFDDKTLNRKHSAVYKFCLKRKTISERLGTTSAFNQHLRLVYPAKQKEYLMQSNANENDGQTTVDSFFELNANYSSEPLTSQSTKKYAFNEKHPRRKAINDAIVKDLIVGCSLPISITENFHFRHFLKDLEWRYTTVTRKTLRMTLIPQMYKEAVQTNKNLMGT